MPETVNSRSAVWGEDVKVSVAVTFLVGTSTAQVIVAMLVVIFVQLSEPVLKDETVGKYISILSLLMSPPVSPRVNV